MEQFIEALKNFFAQVWSYVMLFFGKVEVWFNELDVNNLMKIFYLFSIAALFVGLIKLITKKNLKKIELKTSADEIISLITDPEKRAKEVIATYKTVKKGVTTMGEKIKNFFKRIWANKASIFSILVSAAGICVAVFIPAKQFLEETLPFFKENQVLSWFVCGVIAAVSLGIDIYCIVTKYGIESIEEFAARLEEKKVEKEAKLTPEQKAAYKEKLKIFNKGLAEVKEKIALAESKIAELKTLIDNGLATAEQVQEYNGQVAEVNTLTQLSVNYEAKVAEVKEALAA